MTFRNPALPATCVAILLAVATVALAPPPAAAQAPVRVTGRVLDRQNAVPLPGVPVERVGTDNVVYTDVDGRYTLLVPRGRHRVKVSLGGYDDRIVEVDVTDGGAVTLDVGLSMTGFEEAVTVRAEGVDAASATAEAQLIARKHAAVVADNIGAAEMRANNDGSAAAGMQRVTGVSVVGDGFVFVRGLGERYSSTTLGGVSLPTTEPERRVVPLDLFPAGLLDSVQVAKSYLPDQSAEFAGGQVQIEPLAFPRQQVLDVSFGLGVNGITTGRSIPGSRGGSRDYLGFGRGARQMPDIVPGSKVIRGGGRFTPDVGFSRAQLERFGEAFDNEWSPTTRTGAPNQNVGLVYGGRAGKLGLVASVTQVHREQYHIDRQVTYTIGDDGRLEEFVDYDFAYATTSGTLAGVANLAYQFSPAHRLSLENFVTHDGENEARTYEGFNGEAGRNQRAARLFWVEEQIASHNVSGEHFFQGLRNSSVEWRVGYGGATRDEPDLRETVYQQIPGQTFQFADVSQSGFRMFNALDDRTIDGSASWSLLTAVAGRPARFKFGGSYLQRERDFQSRRFRLVPLSVTGLDLTQTPERLFTPEHIGPHFELKEETRPTDFYDAEQKVAAGFGMADLAVSARLRVIGGLRVEQFRQDVDTRDLFSLAFEPEVIRSRLDETNLFPAVSLVYAARPNTNIRLSVSQTANRPEFRELAPFEFTDVVGGRSSVGNPDLQQAIIRNYDVRYEIFPRAEEVLAVSLFYKQFDRPIERVLQPTANIRTSYANAERADNFGIELEARKRLNGYLFVGANYAFIDSEVTLSPAAAQVQTSLSRPLAGQSRHLANVLAELRLGPGAVRALYNVVGERITDVGASGLPDILQKGRQQLDLVYTHRLFDKLTFRANVDNLTNAAYEFTQGGLQQRYFEYGRTYGVSLSVNAF
jgi:outer membrane receptor protein involved in Fe transport